MDMILFDIKKLERGLIEGTVSEEDSFNYLLITSIVVAVAPFLLDSSEGKLMHWSELLFELGLTIVLLKSTFNINARGDNREYLKRYTSVSLVSFIRLFVFAIPPVFILVIILQVLKSRDLIDYDRFMDFFMLSLSIIMGIVYYFMLTHSFRRISRRK